MSTSTGTATSYLDLLNKLRTFLTTDATLVAAGRNWTELASSSSSYTFTGTLNGTTGNTDTVAFESYLRAPGLTGSETIYINIRAFFNVASDYYNFEMRGAAGYNSGATFTTQPGISPGAYMPLWNSSIPYWFIANGQRVIVIAKVSTVYESMYLGKFLPYGTPGQYPYPLAIGGSAAESDRRFSDTTGFHAAFFDPINLQICHVDSSWQQAQNWNTGRGGSTVFNVWPWLFNNGSTRPTFISANLDGGYSIFPSRLEMKTPANVLGELDGVGFVTGNANGSENTINDGTNTWTVFQDTFRTGADNYCAIKMV